MLEMMQPRIGGGLDEEAPITASLATATMAPFTTELDDLFISVKTTKHYHHSRLMAIIGTWFQFAKDQVSFIVELFSGFQVVETKIFVYEIVTKKLVVILLWYIGNLGK